MKKHRILTSAVAGALTFAMLSGVAASVPLPVSAEKSSGQIQSEIDSMKDKRNEIAAEIDELDSKISNNKDEMAVVVANKNIIEQEISLLHSQISTINEQISAHSILIADHQQKLVEAEANLEQLNQKNKDRIQAMEEAGPVSYWSVLFRASSFTDLLDRLVMIEDIAASDQRRLEEMRQAAQVVADTKAQLESEKAELDATREELNASKAQLDLKVAEADALLEQLLASGVEYQNLLAEASARNNDVNDQISQLESQYDEAKKREYQEWLDSQPKPEPKPTPTTPDTPSVNPDSSGISWVVPINYIMVSSPFGYREHPIYHTQRLHAGIDLAANQGTPIVASRSGVVSTATYDNSAGYYVSINHMDGYSTRYMHMTHFVVSEGEYVQAGQVIGYCGSTGMSTGPHLHFGVYYNGTPINPAPFIGL